MKIQDEINFINHLYEKTINDLTKSFQIKHEKLLKEENDLKEILNYEVTKVKERLENFWSQTNKEIKVNEILKKGIKNFKNEEKIVNKNLFYISKINKNIYEMTKLLQEQMKSIKFSFKEEETKINYEEYYFNVYPVPKDIKFFELSNHNVKITRKIDNKIKIDNNKIKYKI